MPGGQEKTRDLAHASAGAKIQASFSDADAPVLKYYKSHKGNASDKFVLRASNSHERLVQEDGLTDDAPLVRSEMRKTEKETFPAQVRPKWGRHVHKCDQQ